MLLSEKSVLLKIVVRLYRSDKMRLIYELQQKTSNGIYWTHAGYYAKYATALKLCEQNGEFRILKHPLQE